MLHLVSVDHSKCHSSTNLCCFVFPALVYTNCPDGTQSYSSKTTETIPVTFRVSWSRQMSSSTNLCCFALPALVCRWWHFASQILSTNLCWNGRPHLRKDRLLAEGPSGLRPKVYPLIYALWTWWDLEPVQRGRIDFLADEIRFLNDKLVQPKIN